MHASMVRRLGKFLSEYTLNSNDESSGGLGGAFCGSAPALLVGILDTLCGLRGGLLMGMCVAEPCKSSPLGRPRPLAFKMCMFACMLIKIQNLLKILCL